MARRLGYNQPDYTDWGWRTVNPLQIDRLPSLRAPTFIAAFRGWNDSGEAGSLAVRHLVETWSAEAFANIDAEDFFDFTVVRPIIRGSEEGLRDLRWPLNRFFYHRRDDADSDVVLLLGREPHLKWRSFTEAVLDLFDQVNGSRLITLSAFAGAAPHTRPLRISGFATEAPLQREFAAFGASFSNYEGPTGIVGALHDAWHRRELSSAGLWVTLPAYLGNSMNPPGALALLQAMDRLLAFEPDLARLADASDTYLRGVDQALANNDEVKSYIAELEQRLDTGINQPELPRSSEIISDLEDFLRRQREDG